MGRTKKLLPETWYEYQEQLSLDWMEKEYFDNLAKQNIKKNPYDYTEKQKTKARLKSKRTHENSSQQDDETRERLASFNRRGGAESLGDNKTNLS